MNEYKEYIQWIANKLPLIAIAIIGGVAGESIKNQRAKYQFRLRHIPVFFASALLTVGVMDSYDLHYGLQVAGAVLGGFIGKDGLIYGADWVRGWAQRKIKKDE